MANTVANGAVRTANVAQMNSAARGDLLIITRSSNGQTRSITVQNLLANSDFDLKAANLVINSSLTAPAGSDSITIPKGQIFYDNNYIYIAVANNFVKRAAISSF